MESSRPIVLFDGVCNLCSRSVQFILQRDHRKRFLFASLQGKTGQEILRKNGLPTDTFHSFILAEGDHIYSRSAGALRMLLKLGGFWRLFYLFILVPPFLRDGIYNWIARKRYHWFGQKEECWVPRPEWRDRFLD